MTTNIEWVKNPDGTQGITWNPITGCLNHVNGLCRGGGFPCYAYRLANGRLKQRYLMNGLVACDYEGGEEGSDLELKAAFADPFYPRFWEDRLNDLGRKPKGIFVCDMGDLFGVDVPEEWIRKVLEAICHDRKDRFYLLTKQPQNVIKFSPFPENCWVGVTATNQAYITNACHYLRQVNATIKFLSLEPLLDLQRIALDTQRWLDHWLQEASIDWLIIGACTGTWGEMDRLERRVAPLFPNTLMKWGNKWTLQPRIEWLREIVEAADKAGIPVFLKDNLNPLLEGRATQDIVDMGFAMKHTTNPSAWQLRQEMPER